MPKKEKTASLRQQASNLRSFLKIEHSIELTHSEALERTAKLHGYANWDTAAGVSQRQGGDAPPAANEAVQIAQLFALRAGIENGGTWDGVMRVLCRQKDPGLASAWGRAARSDRPKRDESLADILRETGIFDEPVLLLVDMGSRFASGNSGLGEAIGYLKTIMTSTTHAEGRSVQQLPSKGPASVRCAS